MFAHRFNFLYRRLVFKKFSNRYVIRSATNQNRGIFHFHHKGYQLKDLLMSWWFLGRGLLLAGNPESRSPPPPPPDCFRMTQLHIQKMFKVSMKPIFQLKLVGLKCLSSLVHCPQHNSSLHVLPRSDRNRDSVGKCLITWCQGCDLTIQTK